MTESDWSASFLRWLAVALAIIFIIVAGGIATAGAYHVLSSWLRPVPAAIVLLVMSAAGAAIFWPAWLHLRQWAGVPRLDS